MVCCGSVWSIAQSFSGEKCLDREVEASETGFCFGKMLSVKHQHAQ